MSKLLEHIIRNVLTESLKTGWFFKILGGGTIRTNLADQLAVGLGAKQGVIVIGTPAQKFLRDGVPPSEDIEAIISDVVSTTFQRSPVYSKFYDDNQHSYIFQVLKSKKRRKKFLFLIEQKSKYAKLINQIKSAEARDGYFKTSANPDIDKIGTIPVMSGDEYRLWKSGIDKSIQNIESRSKQSDSNITPSMVDAIKKTYDSIKFLDVSKMKVRVDIPDVEATETIVTIDQAGFKGTARKTIDATGKVKYIPVEGVQLVMHRDGDGNKKSNSDSGQFDGKFAENGMPESGTVKWFGPRGNEGLILGGIEIFRGKLFTYKQASFGDIDIENPGFTFKYDTGYFKYWSGHEFRGSYKSVKSQQWDGDGILGQKTNQTSRNLALANWTNGDLVKWIENSLKKQNISYTITPLLYTIGKQIAFKGDFKPFPNNGVLLINSSVNAFGSNQIGTLSNGQVDKIEFTEDFLTKLENAKQEIDAIKIFEDETGDLEFLSNKKIEGETISNTVSIPKSEIKDLTLLSGQGNVYTFSYRNNDLNKRYPSTEKYTYYINIDKQGLTPEFIELQKTLGNIKKL